MASTAHSLPLTRDSVLKAHELINPHVHLTPIQTNTTLSLLTSTPQSPSDLVGTPWEGQKPADPNMRLFFKCENFQRIGAFKVRGAFHAMRRLIEERGIEDVRTSGVITHSSGEFGYSKELELAPEQSSKPMRNYLLSVNQFCRQPCAGTRFGCEGIFDSGAHSDANDIYTIEDR